MRLLAPLAVALSCVAAAAACSSSTMVPASPANDGGTQPGSDAAPGSGLDALAPANACGPAPYVQLDLTITAATTGTTTGAPVAGAKFTSTLCPGNVATSDANGKISGLVSKGATFYGRFEATNFVKMLTPEERYDADDLAATVQMVPSLFTSIVTGYDASKATIFIGAMLDGVTGACAALDGISFAVLGHPELSPTYYSAAAIPSAVAGATKTTTSGRASFAPLDAGDPLTLTATKAGCEVSFVHGSITGRAPREAGYVTFIGAYVHDLGDGGASDASSD